RQGVSNSLYVHSSPSFAALWLAPRLRAFVQAYPDISFNMSASPTHSDFALGQADIDIRYGIPQWPNLVVEPLFVERIVPLASAITRARLSHLSLRSGQGPGSDRRDRRQCSLHRGASLGVGSDAG